MIGPRPTTRETRFRSENDEFTTWRQFLIEGIITQKQYESLLGCFQPMIGEGKGEGKGKGKGKDEDEHKYKDEDEVD